MVEGKVEDILVLIWRTAWSLACLWGAIGTTVSSVELAIFSGGHCSGNVEGAVG